MVDKTGSFIDCVRAIMSQRNIEKPLIVQSDQSLLLEVENPLSEECRFEISRFAELEKSPEYLHTYRITSLSLWNAAASNLTHEEMIAILEKYSKYSIPQSVVYQIRENVERFGKLILEKDEAGNLFLVSKEREILREIASHRKISSLIEKVTPERLQIKRDYRGKIKQVLISIGFPVDDQAGYDKGAKFTFNFRDKLGNGKKFALRDYQKKSVDLFHAKGGKEGGSGVIVLPCGAGKTLVGIGVMQIIGTKTLILATNTLSVRQWKEELIEKTDISAEDIGEYSGEVKEIKPITIATYNIITHRKSRDGEFTHYKIFNADAWGLIIYDEVHLLPARVFRVTSELQSKRRLGLTATLVREDGMEDDVFTMIGPKKYDVPWKSLEQDKWIAKATCMEVRVNMDENMRTQYSISSDREKYRIASENPNKVRVIERIIKEHGEGDILIIGQYLSQLRMIAQHLKYPIVTGVTPIKEREVLYEDFKKKKCAGLIVSRVANFSINLPDARVAIQVSGSFGSRQEEAQRLGRILRPKETENFSYFYSLITRDSSEEQFGRNRQLFLTEQGYSYKIFNDDIYSDLDNGNKKEGLRKPLEVG